MLCAFAAMFFTSPRYAETDLSPSSRTAPTRCLFFQMPFPKPLQQFSYAWLLMSLIHARQYRYKSFHSSGLPFRPSSSSIHDLPPASRTMKKRSRRSPSAFTGLCRIIINILHCFSRDRYSGEYYVIAYIIVTIPSDASPFSVSAPSRLFYAVHDVFSRDAARDVAVFTASARHARRHTFASPCFRHYTLP